jgi:hypothetical protein
MKEIPLTRGYVAIVDNRDFAWLSKYKWHAGGVVEHIAARRKENWKNVYMHRMIMGEPKGLEIDHINHNPLDNRRRNLRIVTHAGAKGYRKTRQGHYEAYKKINNHSYNLGTYKTAREARKAYEEFARKMNVPTKVDITRDILAPLHKPIKT